MHQLAEYIILESLAKITHMVYSWQLLQLYMGETKTLGVHRSVYGFNILKHLGRDNVHSVKFLEVAHDVYSVFSSLSHIFWMSAIHLRCYMSSSEHRTHVIDLLGVYSGVGSGLDKLLYGYEELPLGRTESKLERQYFHQILCLLSSPFSSLLLCDVHKIKRKQNDV